MADIPSFNDSFAIAYERHLVPLIFEPFADEMARRIVALKPNRVLELGAGTGVVTRALAKNLEKEAEIVATDLSDDMLEVARHSDHGGATITWRVEDAMALSFPDGSFDAVVCQFAVMFFPDKAKGFSEALRALRPGGSLIFNSWSPVQDNPLFKLAFETLPTELKGPVSKTFDVPFGYADKAEIRQDMEAGGLSDIEIETVQAEAKVASAEAAAIGYVKAAVMRSAIEELGGDLDAITDDVARAITGKMGEGPFMNPLSAVFMSARKS